MDTHEELNGRRAIYNGMVGEQYNLILVPNENASKVMLTLLRAVGARADDYGFGEAQTRDSLGAIET